MCNDSSNPSPCNRRPFASDDGCDRGSVDIFQFGDLPYCGTIDPTMPEIPPEVQDGPVPIPVPAYNCTCFNIDYKFDLKYNENRSGNSFSTSASFAAVGDCCEGMYETRFKLRIPCPVKNKAGRKIKVGIAYGSGPQSASASFIAADSSNCLIEPLSPSLNLNIPCPVKNSSGGRLRLGIKYGVGPSGASVSFIRGNSTTCEMEPLSPNVALNIPCPVKASVSHDDKKIKVGISYGDGPNEVSDSFISTDPETCAIKPSGANIKLNIPCPMIGFGGDKKIKASIRYGDGNEAASATFIKTDAQKCTLEGMSPELNLNIKCPAPTGAGTVSAGVRYGVAQKNDNGTVVDADHSTCNIGFSAANLSLNVPCPVKVRKKNGKTANIGGIDGIGTGLDPLGGLTYLGPIKLKASFRFDSNSGSPASVSASLGNVTTGCGLSVNEETRLDLKVPCPVRKSALVIETSHSGSGNLEIVSDSESGDCKRRIKIKATFPRQRPDFNILAGSCTNLVVTRSGDDYVIGVYYV